MDYPQARRLDLVEQVHGTEVADPYRWLEDPGSAETAAWSATQDELARRLLDGLPGREGLRARLGELLAAGLASVPEVRGRRAFFTRRGPGQEHAVLLVREGDTERVLIDPSTLSDDDTVTLDGWVPSVEGDRLAYWLSQGGDEEASLSVMDVASGEVIDGPIDRTRYCPLAWLPGGERFCYGRRLPPDAVPQDEDRFHRRLWLHRIGDDPDGDELVFGEGRDKTEYHSVEISHEGRWLVIGAALGTAPRNDLYVADLAGDLVLRPVQEGLDASTYGQVAHDGRLYLRTNLGAARFRVVVADPARPEPLGWRDLVPEGETVIEDFAVTGDALLVAGTRHAVGRVSVHDLADGAVRAEVELPGLGSVRGVTARPDGGDEAWIGWTDFTTPPRVYRYAVGSGTLELWMDAPGRVEAKGVVARQESYRSADGTEVRMFVLHREGLAADGGRPTILYGYGGFNIALTPEYSASILAWVERGGVYAIANLRGGSEEGEAWHRAGGAAPGGAGLDLAAAARHRRRLQRRPAGGRRPDPAPGAVRGGGVQRAAAGHGPLRALRPRRDLERRVRARRRPDRVRLALCLLAVPPRHHGQRLPGGAVQRVRVRHEGRPAPRPQALRRPAVGDHLVPAGDPAARGPGGARCPLGQPHRRPGGRHLELPGGSARSRARLRRRAGITPSNFR